jgi:hypothetical protein
MCAVRRPAVARSDEKENLAGVWWRRRETNALFNAIRCDRCIEAKREGPLMSIKEVSAERAEPLTRTQVLHTQFLKVGAI